MRWHRRCLRRSTPCLLSSRLPVPGAPTPDQLNNTINEYDPSLGDAIGGTEQGMLNAIQDAGNDVEQGQYLKGVDDLFGLPIWESGDPSGDYDDFPQMLDYFDYVSVGGGGCV
jgi:hypothetical protein